MICLHCEHRPANRARGLCCRCYASPGVKDRYPVRDEKKRQGPCQHCRTAPSARPRGLCHRCYYTPAVRALYPSTSKYGRRSGVPCPDEFEGPAPLPSRPTGVCAGSPEKVEVLARRASLRQELWHPDDSVALAPDDAEDVTDEPQQMRA